MPQEEPIVLDALDPSVGDQSTIIFLHGLGDDAYGSGYGK